MKSTETPDEVVQQVAPPNTETMTLDELIPHWTNMIWLLGMRPMFQNLQDVSLTISDNIILRQLHRRSMTISEVATELSLTHSSASRTVDRLVNDGLVQREENPADRRQKILNLTGDGRALMQDIEGKLTDGIEYLVARLSLEEQEQFRRLVAHMVSANCAEQNG